MITKRFCAAAFVLFTCLIPSYATAWTEPDTDALLKKMEAAYAEVEDYQVNVEVRNYRSNGSTETQKFLYTFKKPDRIRLDFDSPHSGMVMAYPDQNGKVVVRPQGLGRLFKLHLAPGSSLLESPSGQRIDQTDMGLLIKNIHHSMTDQRRGPLDVTEDHERILIRVLAEHHFHKGTVTLYRFIIDKKIWLPVKVEESSKDGRMERSVIFRNLKTNRGTPDSFFRVDG